MVQMYEQNGSESVLASSGRIYRMLDPTGTTRCCLRSSKKHGDAINRAVRYIRANVGKKNHPA